VRRLAPEEAALWKRVIETVKPIAKAKAAPAPEPALPPGEGRGAVVSGPKPGAGLRRGTEVAKPAAPKAPPPSDTLDGSWDRRLSRGLVAPESSVDLHGHTLATAYDRLDKGLEYAVAHGDRVLLLITGKPPAPESERPHSRGAIRAAVGDWLKASRFSDRIAAVRGAHPRHGGAGALYIVLRRPKPAGSRKY
jgi:DNA-nicking Smr family endonuclease